MKKIIPFIDVFILLFSFTNAQMSIQAMGPTDICTGGNSVTLSVVSPQAGYTYSWFVGSYGCFATGLPNPYPGFGMNTGTSLQVYGTGEFYCIGAPAT